MQERQTKQKQIIYDVLKTLDHPTATEVYSCVHQTYPNVSRATVFRVLGGFATNGKASELRVAGSDVRYDYNTAPHYHAHCVKCGKFADVWLAEEERDFEVSVREDFDLEGYTIEFFGTCANCKAEKF